MRVLHVISEMGTGGAEAVVLELLRGGREHGWRSAVASAGGANEDRVLDEGLAEVHRVPASRRRATGVLTSVAATRRALRATSPDVVVAHNVGVTAVVAAARMTLHRRTPLVSVFHGVAAQDYRNAARILSVAPDRVVAVSEAIAARLGRAGLRGPDPDVIPNAVTAPLLPVGPTARAELALPPEAPVALCAARLVPQKRHDVLVEAWAGVRPDAVLLLAGDGPLRGELEDDVRRRGLGGRVRLLGDRDDVPRLLACADLAVLASDWEGLPIFVLEAMAVGRPVVATDVDGLREVLRDGGGRLVPPGSPALLAAALSELLDDPSTRAAAALEAQRASRERYDSRRMVQRYDELLTSLVRDRGAEVA